MSFIKAVYILAVAVLVTMFVGFGIAAFYESPAAPEYPEPPSPRPVEYPVPPPKVDDDYYQSPEYQQYQLEVKDFEEKRRAHDEAMEIYRRNVFFIAFAFGLASIIVGLLLGGTVDAIRSGLVLGGTITVIYGTVQYFGAMSDKARFAVIALGLAVLIYVGYRRLRERRGISNSQPDRNDIDELSGGN